MTDQRIIRLVKMVNILSAPLITILMLTVSSAAPQGPPVLQISSPASGVLINPGQALSVTVSSPTPSAFTKVMLTGQGPLGFSNIATSLPAQFSISIPGDAEPGKYNLTASGITVNGTEVDSAPIFVDLERPDLPTTIAAAPSRITFETHGATFPLEIAATFFDGSYLHVASSSYVTFSSSNPTIVTVDPTGLATAVAAGNATITATYTLGSQSLHVAVPVTVGPPILTASPSALTFGNQTIGTTSASQTLTLTNVSHGPISVLTVGATGDFSETDNCVSSSPLAVNSACTITVSFSPSGAGLTAGTVDVSYDLSIAQFSIPISGTGICHYVSFSASPSAVPQGGTTILTGTLRSCANTAQTITVQFALTAPAQGNCSATNSLMFTTPPFTLQPNISQTFSFFAQVPSGICPGPYTVVATTLVNGQAVDTSTATLTVTP